VSTPTRELLYCCCCCVCTEDGCFTEDSARVPDVCCEGFAVLCYPKVQAVLCFRCIRREDGCFTEDAARVPGLTCVA
jgi:hypothetical protein